MVAGVNSGSAGSLYRSISTSQVTAGDANITQTLQYSGNGQWSPISWTPISQNVNASSINTGTLPDTRLSARVPLLDSPAGRLPDSLLSANVPLRNVPNTFTGAITAPAFVGAFTGDGAGLTNLNVGGSSTYTGPLTLDNTAKAPRLRLTGTEYHAPNQSSANGIDFLLGWNRTGNRQLFLADSASTEADTSTGMLRFSVGGSTPTIDAYSLDLSATKDLALQPNGGRVLIGNTGPAFASAKVMIGNPASVSTSASAYYRWNASGGSFVNSPISTSYSLCTVGFVLVPQIDTYSDARLKNITGPSDSAVDLKTLLGLRITDYTFKDKLEKGDKLQKKLIAQQVEQVYPQAVKQTTGVVPDIFQKASIKDGWITLKTDVKKGERVRLIAEKGEGIHEVLEVRDGAFRTDFKTEGAEVFVYGREVKDLRVVDYDAIAMLNVSATQQLKQEKDAEITALKQQLAEQRAIALGQAAMMKALETRLAAIERGLDRTVSATVALKK